MLHIVHMIERRFGRSPVRMLLLVSTAALLLGLGLLQGTAAAAVPAVDCVGASIACTA